MKKEKQKPKQKPKAKIPVMAVIEVPTEDKREGCEFKFGDVSLSSSGDLNKVKKVFFEFLDKVDFKKSRRSYIG